MPKYEIKSKANNLTFKRSDGSLGIVDTRFFIEAINEFDRIIKIFDDVEIPIGDILGLRNLSAFVGEVFNRSVKKISGDYIQNNPHQDGYPDLLVMDNIGKNLWDKLSSQHHEKQPFSPFAGGGIEVKATCGDLKSGKWFTEKNIPKPIIGDQRLEWVTGYNWKAHHRETNNLIGLIWDFVERKPTIVSIMYSNNLQEEDWGKTVTPKEGGVRTTSVSIMNKMGINKMKDGIILLINDQKYSVPFIKKLSKY